MYVVLAGRVWYFAASRVGTEAGDHQGGAESERGSLTAKGAKGAKKDPVSGVRNTACPGAGRKMLPRASSADPEVWHLFAVFASFAVKYCGDSLGRLVLSGRIGVCEKCDRVGGKRVFWKPCAMGG